ncbi:MAG: hypothetical protein AAFZ58_16005, partial [Pseudomonadota bacterium]
MRLLIAGLLVGLLGGGAAAALIRPISHDYIASLSRVGEGGRAEAFQIVLPDDRLLNVGAGVPAEAVVPLGRYIEGARLATIRAGVFQLRDARDRVVGLASLLTDLNTARDEWVLYMPSRGALFLTQTGVQANEAGQRIGVGRVVGGTETLSGQRGTYELRTVSDDN